jgi:hypothetical protein
MPKSTDPFKNLSKHSRKALSEWANDMLKQQKVYASPEFKADMHKYESSSQDERHKFLLEKFDNIKSRLHRDDLEAIEQGLNDQEVLSHLLNPQSTSTGTDNFLSPKEKTAAGILMALFVKSRY